MNDLNDLLMRLYQQVKLRAYRDGVRLPKSEFLRLWEESGGDLARFRSLLQGAFPQLTHLEEIFEDLREEA